MSVEKYLEDVYIVLDVHVPRWKRFDDEEQRAKWIEQEAKEVERFIKDHKSLDVHDVYVKYDYIYFCGECRREETSHFVCDCSELLEE